MKSLPSYLDDLPDVESLGARTAIDAYALRLRGFYHARAIWNRRFYRLSGVLVILTGAALPLLATLEYPGKTLVISLAGAIIALLTGLNAFYRWDQSWVLVRGTEITLTSAYWRWRTSNDADDIESAATQDFLTVLAEVRDHEATAFFKNLTFPSTTPLNPTTH
ncbi:MAG TPA: DUF4231 domain-containing protein [Actinokineospora sp.]|jgi:hypothetical protein|nr:DUF4231 domain-containing protein [Actinokineospora sp.]